MIPVAEAIHIIRQQTPVLPADRVVLADALGRFLAEEVVADSDLPPFDRSQMDGYAVRAEDVATVPTSLRIVGESAAGRGWHHEMQAGQAVRIMTGKFSRVSSLAGRLSGGAARSIRGRRCCSPEFGSIRR